MQPLHRQSSCYHTALTHCQAFPITDSLTPPAYKRLLGGPLFQNKTHLFLNQHSFGTKTAMALIGGLTGLWTIALLTIQSANAEGRLFNIRMVSCSLTIHTILTFLLLIFHRELEKLS